MKRRLGVALLVMLTLLLLKLGSLCLGLLNLDSDVAVTLGILGLAVILVICPYMYVWTWKHLINFTIPRENTHEV